MLCVALLVVVGVVMVDCLPSGPSGCVVAVAGGGELHDGDLVCLFVQGFMCVVGGADQVDDLLFGAVDTMKRDASEPAGGGQVLRDPVT